MSKVGIVTYDLHKQSGSLCRSELQQFIKHLALKGGALLGVDVGTLHIGLAVSDPSNRVVLSQTSFRRRHVKDDIACIRKVAKAVDAKCAVVGIPIPLLGTDNSKIQRFIRVYAERSLYASGLEVIGYWDESNTSAFVKEAFLEVAKKKQRNSFSISKHVSDSVSCNASNCNTFKLNSNCFF